MTIGMTTGLQTRCDDRFANRSSCVNSQIHCFQTGHQTCLILAIRQTTGAMCERSCDRYDDRFANLCKLSGLSLADCISMVLTARVDFTKYYYYYYYLFSDYYLLFISFFIIYLFIIYLLFIKYLFITYYLLFINYLFTYYLFSYYLLTARVDFTKYYYYYYLFNDYYLLFISFFIIYLFIIYLLLSGRGLPCSASLAK